VDLIMTNRERIGLGVGPNKRRNVDIVFELRFEAAPRDDARSFDH